MNRSGKLQHESEAEDVKLVGVFSTRRNAEDALARVRERPGFRDEPSGFSIDGYGLDCDDWVSGFVREPSKPDEMADAAA